MGLTTITTNNKRKDLSVNEKLSILKSYDELPKMSQRSAAVHLKISQPLLCRILKNRTSIENSIRQNANTIRKRNRGGKDVQVETALKLWLKELQDKNVAVSGKMVRGKAAAIAKELGKNFVATDGWFNRWKRRENIICDKLNINSTTFGIRKTESQSRPTELCQVILRSDAKPPGGECENRLGSLRDESFQSEKIVLVKTADSRPTDDDMLEALRVLELGVKARTDEMTLHYDYERFIRKLLRK